ncbi:MAG: hypothetical protein LC739_12810, partial [Actinobacteria bacterium]|nr:hypothetical protein [Actinomycetota bacterium]
ALRRSSDAALAEAVRYVVVLAHDLSAARRVAGLLTEPTRSPDGRAMGHAILAHLELGLGRLAASEKELERLEVFDPTTAVEYRALFSVLPHLAVGPEELSSNLEAVERLEPDAVSDHPGECLAIAIHDGLHDILREYLLGLLHARLLDEDGARSHADRLASLGKDAEGRSLADDFAWSLRAWSYWWAGEPDEALFMAERARLEAWNEPLLYSPFRSRVLDRFLRGRLLENTERWKEAESWYASIEEYAAHDAILFAPSLLGLGRIRDRAEDANGAANSFDRLLRLLESADSEFQPLVDETRQRLGITRTRRA